MLEHRHGASMEGGRCGQFTCIYRVRDILSLRSSCIRSSFRVLYATESQRARTIVTGSHEEQLAMLFVSVGLREVPDRALRLIMTASANDGGARVLVEVLIGPLPYVADHIHHAKWAGPLGMRIHVVRGKHRTAVIRNRCRSIVFQGAGNWTSVPGGRKPVAVPPRKSASIVALRRILPLPLAGKPLPGPFRILTGILNRYPSYRLFCPSIGIGAILPVLEEVETVLVLIVRCIQEFLKLGIGHWIL